MTTSAIGSIMWANQRKTAALVHLRGVFHDPRLGCMASLTVGTHGLIVHVGVTVDAPGSGIFKNQCGMAQSAVKLLVLTGEGELTFVMVIGVDLFIELPPFCTVTKVATHGELLPMWVWRWLHLHQRHKNQCQEYDQ